MRCFFHGFRRRAQQLKVAKQKEKEWQKSQNRRDRNSTVSCRKKRHIEFENSVMLLEAAARNDIVEVRILKSYTINHGESSGEKVKKSIRQKAFTETTTKP